MIKRLLAFWRRATWVNSPEFKMLIERVERLSADSNALAHRAAFLYQAEDDVRGDILNSYSMVEAGNTLDAVPHEVWVAESIEWTKAADKLDGRTTDALH